MRDERRGNPEDQMQKMGRLGRSVFFRILMAALLPFVLLFVVAMRASGVLALLVAGGIGLALLLVCVCLITRDIVRPIRLITEQADAVTEDNAEMLWGEVPVVGAAREVALLRNALIRMTDTQMSANERKLAVLQAELESARQALSADARNRFVANLSRELRVPLNAIIGITEQILRERLGARQTKYVVSIKTSVESLLSVINDTLDLAEMESGQFSLVSADYDFGETLRNLREEAEALVMSKPLVLFEMSVDESVPVCLYGDEVRMQQMLINLLKDAIQSTNEGFVRFRATADDENLHFEVSGTGTAIAQEDLPKRFDPIHSFSGMIGDGYFSGGVVLGLAISRFLAVAMDGTMKVESEVVKGTTFRVIVPRMDGNPAAASFQGRIASFRAPQARVLVVDDKILNLDVAEGLLSLYELTCERATSGREAIDLIRRNNYDIVFMDYSMPDMDGVQTTAAIRAQGGAFAKLPIVAIISNLPAGASALFLSSGFSDFLEKPIEMENLRAVLLKWLPGHTIRFRDERRAGAQGQAAYTPVLRAMADISELDISLGLARVSGKQDAYERAIKITMETVHLMASALVVDLSQGDLDSVRLHADAAKRSLSNIGATRLAILAADLEHAAETGDIVACRESTPHFIDRLDSFVEALDEVFDRVLKNTRPHEEDAPL